MEALALLVMGLSNIACFFLGARIGQKVAKGEEIKMPAIDPAQSYREREARKEAQREKDQMDAILRNIENYDGTEFGQEDVPERSGR